jgi:hypothetical protein
VIRRGEFPEHYIPYLGCIARRICAVPVLYSYCICRTPRLTSNDMKPLPEERFAILTTRYSSIVDEDVKSLPFSTGSSRRIAYRGSFQGWRVNGPHSTQHTARSTQPHSGWHEPKGDVWCDTIRYGTVRDSEVKGVPSNLVWSG